MRRSSRTLALVVVLAAGALLAPGAGYAGEFRSIAAIGSAPPLGKRSLDAATAALPGGLQAGAEQRAMELARQGLLNLIAAWNHGRLEPFLADNFYDRARFLDNLEFKVPRDAKLRLLGLQSVTPRGFSVTRDGAAGMRLDCRVSIVLRSQVEYDDPTHGAIRLQGSNEYFFKVSQWLPETPPLQGR